jgi:hypothetical protein
MMERGPESVEEVVEQMKLLLEAIPPRPSVAEVESAKMNIRDEEIGVATKLNQLFAQRCPRKVPPPAFRALLELHEGVIRTQSEVRRKEDDFLLQLEERYRRFDDLLQKAQQSLPKIPAAASKPYNNVITLNNHVPVNDSSLENGVVLRTLSDRGLEDSGAVTRSLSDGGEKPTAPEPFSFRTEQPSVEGGNFSELLALTRQEGRQLLAGQQGNLAKGDPRAVGRTGELDLGKSVSVSDADHELLTTRWPPSLLDILETAEQGGEQPESLNFANGGYNWMPDSISLLTNLKVLNLSGNQLTGIPDTIGELKSLVELDLEANGLKSLPDSIGELSNLQKLNLEKNSIEEIPWTIGGCTSLRELRADFNQLKALPEAIGQLRELRYLSVHLNSLKMLPTTMSSLVNLTDLFVNFNHLETIPESICSLPNLTRLDASSNFAEFRYLPANIGDLQSLRDLDLSFNHITVLPDSFAKLTNLQRLNLDGNPWKTPPLEVVAQGKDAVFEYLANWKNRDLQVKPKSSPWKVLALVLSFIFKCRAPREETPDRLERIAS